MGNLAVLGGLIINCLVFGLPILFLLLLLINKSRASRLFALLLFLLTTVNAIYFSVSSGDRKEAASKKYLGFYKLNRLDCEDCKSCRINVRSNYTYDIMQNEKVVGEGKWDLEINAETGYFLTLENGPGYMIDESVREIEMISRENCCLAGCDKNIQEEFRGKIVDKKPGRDSFGQNILLIKLGNGDTISYYPKYFKHPWIEDKVQIGDYFSKQKGAMSFKIVHAKGDTIFLNYPTPDCEAICPIK